MSLRAVPKDETPVNEFAPWPVPSERTFDEADYLPAHDLDTLARQLINTHETLFSHLVNVDIICLWKAKGGMSKGKKVLGKTVPASGLVEYFSKEDFIVWLAADHLHGASQKTVEACLFRELCSLQWDAEGGKIVVTTPDCQFYTEEIREYGLWRVELEKARDAMQQLGMFKGAA